MRHDIPSQSKLQGLTAERVKKMLPKGTAHQVTENIILAIENMEDDTGLEQAYMEEQFASHLPLLGKHKVKLEDYISALKYVNLKQHMTNRLAWEIVFPERLAKAEKLLAARAREGRASSVSIDSHVSNYNKNELVIGIDTQMMMAAHIQYNWMFHAAVRKQYDLMNGIAMPNPDGSMNKVSANVQHLAAGKLADLVTAPEEAKVTVDINVNKGSIVDDYEKAIAMMAKAKMTQIEAGGDMLETINAPIRAVEAIDVEIENGN